MDQGRPARLRRALAALGLGCALAPGCGGDGDGAPDPAGAGGSAPCTKPTYGDPSLDIELQVFASDGLGTRMPISDGDAVPLVVPPQGGRVIFLGAKVKNLSACGVQVAGVLRDAMGKTQVDRRTTTLLSTMDGWAETDVGDIAALANVTACPNGWSSGNVYGPMEIEVQVIDGAGRKAKAVHQVKVVCPDDGSQATCECQCKQGYVFGQPCP